MKRSPPRSPRRRPRRRRTRTRRRASPRRSSSSHVLEIKAAHPDWSLGDVGRELGKRWKELTEDDKKPYHDLAAKDAERYKTEMEAYKAKQAADEE